MLLWNTLFLTLAAVVSAGLGVMLQWSRNAGAR